MKALAFTHLGTQAEASHQLTRHQMLAKMQVMGAIVGLAGGVAAALLGTLLITAAVMGGAMGFLWSSLAANVLTNSNRVTFDSAVYHYLRALGAAIGVSVGATATKSRSRSYGLFCTSVSLTVCVFDISSSV